MDTRLKNMIKQWYFKAAGYVIIGICVAFGFLRSVEDTGYINGETLIYKTYEESSPFWSEIANVSSAVANSVLAYESREDISRGKYVEQEQLEMEMQEYYRIWQDEGRGIRFEIDQNGNAIYHNSEMQNNEQGDRSVEDTADSQLPYNYKECADFLKQNSGLEEQLKQKQISEQLSAYDGGVDLLSQIQWMVDTSADKEEISRLEAKYKNLPLYGIYRGDGTMDGTGLRIKDVLYRTMDSSVVKASGKTLFVGMPDKLYNEKVSQWSESKKRTEQYLKLMIGLCAAGFIVLVYLLAVTGKRPGEKEVHLYQPLDFVWTEVQIGASQIAFWGGVFLADVILFEVIPQWLLSICIAGIGVSVTAVLILILSQVRRLKAHKFLEGFVCFRVMRRLVISCIRIMKNIWRKGKISRQAFFMAIFLPILCATWIGAPFVIAFLIYMIYKYIGDFTEICEGAAKVRSGELNYKIAVKNNESRLGVLAEDINEISQGLENAVSNELRSERLKSELISNVSHDLKTPLTSIVTYVDLLKKESIENDTAKDYIEVIDRKAQRLTVLTNDLFEAAKASSGDMPVNLEKVDLNAIIRQALGEFDERIHNAGLEIKCRLLDTPAYIKADGRLTWRVLDNLLNNVVKYAQTGSRVYMDVVEENNGISFTMKNISAYELNIAADELMERFKRGDESRNSEGSGLGLNIANSLISLQHGQFEIMIDGDLFKVCIWMPGIS